MAQSNLDILQACVKKHPKGQKKGMSVEDIVLVYTESALMAMEEWEILNRKTISDKVIAVESASYAERIGVNPISAKLDFEAGMKRTCELLKAEIIETIKNN